VRKQLPLRAVAFLLAAVPLVFVSAMNPAFRPPKQAAVFILAACLAVAWLRAGHLTLRRPFFLLPSVAIFCWAVICSLPALNRYAAGLWLALWALYVVLAWLLSEYLETTGDCLVLFRWVCGAAVVVAGYGLLQVAGIDFIRWNLEGPLSTIGRRNFTGEFIAMVVPYALCLLMLSSTRSQKALWLAVLASFVGVLFFTFTRASWLACLFGSAAFFLLAGAIPSPSRKAVSMVLLGGIFAFAGLVQADGFFKFEKGTVGSRLRIWKTSLRIVRSSPYLGAGPDNFPLAYAKEAADDPASLKRYNVRIDDAHNDYLEAACETGLPGLALFLLFLTLVARQGIRASRLQDRTAGLIASAATASTGALCVNALASFPFSQPHSLVLFWLNCAVLEVLLRPDARPLRIPRPVASAGVGLFLVVGTVMTVDGVASALFVKRGNVWEKRNLRTALGFYEAAVRTNPFNPYALQDAANAAIGLREWDLAFGYLVRARRLHPYLETIYNNIGVVHAVSGRMDEAEKSYRYALYLNPTVAQTWNNLGSVYLETGKDLQTAEDCFRKSLELDPSFLMAHFNLGVVLAERGQKDAATWEFEYCLREEPKFQQAKQWLEKLRGDRR